MADERMDEQELAAYRTRLCGGGAPLDAEEGFAVADEVTRARLREVALEARAEAAESEVAQLRATLYASFDLDKVADVKHAAALERVRRLEEALRPFVAGAGDEDENGWVWVQAQLPEEVVAEARALLKEAQP